MPTDVPTETVGKQTLYRGGDGILRCKPCHNGEGDRHHMQRGQREKFSVCEGGNCACLCRAAVKLRRPKFTKPEPLITVEHFGGITVS